MPVRSTEVVRRVWEYGVCVKLGGNLVIRGKGSLSSTGTGMSPHTDAGTGTRNRNSLKFKGGFGCLFPINQTATFRRWKTAIVRHFPAFHRGEAINTKLGGDMLSLYLDFNKALQWFS